MLVEQNCDVSEDNFPNYLLPCIVPFPPFKSLRLTAKG